MLCDVCGEAYPPHLMEVVDTLGICVDCLPDYMAERNLSDEQIESRMGEKPVVEPDHKRFLKKIEGLPFDEQYDKVEAYVIENDENGNDDLAKNGEFIRWCASNARNILIRVKRDGGLPSCPNSDRWLNHFDIPV